MTYQRNCGANKDPIRYFIAAAFFTAAQRRRLASAILFFPAAEITLFLAGAAFVAAAWVTGDFWGVGTPESSESRIFVKRSISLVSSAAAACMLMFPPV